MLPDPDKVAVDGSKMTMINTQSSLFQTTVEAPSIVYPGTRFELERKGKRVTGSIHLDEPNAMGRSNCRVDYVRRASWTADHEEIALRLVAHWFRDIGGLALLRNYQFCHIMSRLRAAHTEAWMHAAIDTYAKMPWNVENRNWKPLGDFFNSETFDKCMEQSDAFRDHRQSVANERAGLAVEQRIEEREKRNAGLRPINDLSDASLRAYFKAAVADQSAIENADADGMRRAFSEMRPREQQRLLERISMQKCDTTNWRQCCDILGGERGDDTIFFWEVYYRAAESKCRREGLVMSELAVFPDPTQPYHGRLTDLRAEVERRALASADWIQEAHGRSLSGMARDLVEDLRTLRINHWVSGKRYDPESFEETRIRAFVESDGDPDPDPDRDSNPDPMPLLDRLRRRLEDTR